MNICIKEKTYEIKPTFGTLLRFRDRYKTSIYEILDQQSKPEMVLCLLDFLYMAIENPGITQAEYHDIVTSDKTKFHEVYKTALEAAKHAIYIKPQRKVIPKIQPKTDITDIEISALALSVINGIDYGYIDNFSIDMICQLSETISSIKMPSSNNPGAKKYKKLDKNHISEMYKGI